MKQPKASTLRSKLTAVIIIAAATLTLSGSVIPRHTEPLRIPHFKLLGASAISTPTVEVAVLKLPPPPPPETEPIIRHEIGSGLTKSKGVYYYNGRKETYYSQRVLPGGGLSIPGRHVDEAGLIRDGEGYIVISTSDHSKGTVVETSLGTGKVYDTGCASGTTDIYTDW